jgi:RIO kinase 1
VHGDFSEYNLLWHDNQVYVIDVSQSVETDHPAALDFLRKDASNVNDFFGKVGKLDVMNTRQLFDFITTVIDDNEDAEMDYIDKAMKDVQESQKVLSSQSEQERRKNEQQDAVDEAVFMSSFLPRSLNQVADYDVRQIEKGEVEETYAHAVAALTGNREVVEKYNAYQRGEDTVGTTSKGDLADDGINPADDDSMDCGSEEEDSDSEEDSDDDHSVRAARTPEELELERANLKALRKANKKAVREEKTEKRQTKIKKKDKKRAIKKAKAGNRKNK